MGIELTDDEQGIETNQGENNAFTDEVFLELEGDNPFAIGLQTSGAIEGVSDGVNKHNIEYTYEGQSMIDDLYGDSLHLSIDQLNKENALGLSFSDEERIDKEIEDENDE